MASHYFADGHAEGCSLARSVLEAMDPDVREQLTFAVMLPKGKRERADWLNGFAAGVRHVAFNAAVNLRKAAGA
jgi:hypothetical protein